MRQLSKPESMRFWDFTCGLEVRLRSLRRNQAAKVLSPGGTSPLSNTGVRADRVAVWFAKDDEPLEDDHSVHAGVSLFFVFVG